MRSIKSPAASCFMISSIALTELLISSSKNRVKSSLFYHILESVDSTSVFLLYTFTFSSASLIGLMEKDSTKDSLIWNQLSVLRKNVNSQIHLHLNVNVKNRVACTCFHSISWSGCNNKKSYNSLILAVNMTTNPHLFHLMFWFWGVKNKHVHKRKVFWFQICFCLNLKYNCLCCLEHLRNSSFYILQNISFEFSETRKEKLFFLFFLNSQWGPTTVWL